MGNTIVLGGHGIGGQQSGLFHDGLCLVAAELAAQQR
jgi:hypothetical protein